MGGGGLTIPDNPLETRGSLTLSSQLVIIYWKIREHIQIQKKINVDIKICAIQPMDSCPLVNSSHWRNDVIIGKQTLLLRAVYKQA